MGFDYQDFLNILGFKAKNGAESSYYKTFNNYEIIIDFDENEPKNSKINYGNKIKLGRQTTASFKQSENLVVLECVNRLLEKGYLPESITLEQRFKAGHKDCFLDILVKDLEKHSFLMIECKTWGDEYEKEKNKMFRDGGQLLSYYKQDKNAKALCLYSSELKDAKLQYKSEIIDTNELEGNNSQEIFDSWSKSFYKKGIFEKSVEAYGYKNIGLTYEDLQELEKSDGGTIFNQFAEILRRHIVSDKTNAFNKIFNLFICKIQDEDDNYNKNNDLKFQFKKNDTYETLFDRLNDLYKRGNKNYIDVELPDISQDDFEKLLKLTDGKDEKLRKTFNELRYYRSSQEFSFKEVYNKETFEENAEIVKEIVKLLENYKIKYSQKHQYLGDFFELLLNTGIKQEAGQFFTPIPLTRFICKSLPIKQIIESKNNKKEDEFLPYVIDYACGSGHFLTEIMDEIDTYVKKFDEKDIKGSREAVRKFNALRNDLTWAKEYVYGIEKDYRLVKTSKISSFLNGDGDANVMSGDGLAPFTDEKYKGILKTNDYQKENHKFDILIANPPYSVSAFRNTLKDGDKSFDLYKNLTDNSSEIECLFVERAKQLLKEGGVAGIILPISILTNGGIYTKTREIILKNFDIKAIQKLGDNAFMATGTKTIILFMRKKNQLIYSEIKKLVGDFLSNYKETTVNGISKAFSTYVNNVYDDLELCDYISILKGDASEKAKKSELYKDYKLLSINDIFKIEGEKLIYFMLAYPQKIVLGDALEKQLEKEFYGYEFSSRRGHEGIHIYKDENGILESKLFNPYELDDNEKMNSHILSNFNNSNVEETIDEIKKCETNPLKEHIDFMRLSDLMTFDLKTFDKSINLNNKKKIEIESKYELVKVASICDLGRGRVINKNYIKKNSGKYPLYSSQTSNEGVLGYINTFDFDGEYCTWTTDGAKAGTVFYRNGKFNCTNVCGTLKAKNDSINMNYLAFILNTLTKYYVTDVGNPKLMNEDMAIIKVPLPPKNVQKNIVDNINEKIELETKAHDNIKINQEKIKKLINSTGKRKKILDILSLEYGVPLTEKNRIKGDYVVAGANGIIGTHNEYLLEAPSIIVGRKGSAGEVNWIDKNNTPIDTTFYVKLKQNDILKFVYYKLKNMNLTSLRDGLGAGGINRNKIYALDVLMPTAEEQILILEQIEPLEKEIDKARTVLEKSYEEKQKILNKYLA